MDDEKAPKLEPIEIRGLLSYFAVSRDAQEPEARPSGISQWTAEEQINRGKVQFQTRGCLACQSQRLSGGAEVSYRKTCSRICRASERSSRRIAIRWDPTGCIADQEPDSLSRATQMPNLFLVPDKDLGADANSAADDKCLIRLTTS